ncbi:MAG: hypothetical protein KHX24_04180 [Clostridiales bacterium]|nr:hypothetical protein [Clostridiales bacterium]
MKSWGYKIKYTFLRTIRAQWKSMISLFFAFVGVVFTLAEILNNVFESTFGFDFIRSHTIQISLVFVAVCVILNWKPLRYTCFLENADTKITLLVGDIFRQKGAFIIPTNTTFDTLMDDEFISIRSVQGQYQEKYFAHTISTLNREIAQSLNGVPFASIDDGRETNIKRYEIGTTCKVSTGLQHAYFLAVADINKYGKPENVTFDNITIALVSLWQKLNEIGHLESVLIPIIGTGRAGIKNASRDKIVREIIFSFVVAAREMKVTEDLIICIHPSDFAEKNLHWDDLCDYLRYTCKYQYVENSTREGNPETESVVARFG